MAKNNQQMLDEIKAKIVADKVCPELAASATNMVFGDGNPEAQIVFIGEAPGKNEDLQGLPFVGAAGKFLEQMLEMIGIKRRDVYITNIVKYRPPNNRDPLPEEKAAFLPYLRQQLDVIKPKLTIFLGRHSMNTFFPELKISQVHGQPKRILWKQFLQVGGHGASAMQGAGEQQTDPYIQYGEGAAEPATKQRAASTGGAASYASRQAGASVVILPLFHPAAALYNGGMKQTLIDDFARIPLILEQI